MPGTHLTDTYEALIGYARDELRAKDVARAEAIARQALSLLPVRAAAYNILALVHEIRGHHAEAMDMLRAGLSVEPTYKPAQQNLARLGTYPTEGPMVLGDEED